MTARADMQVLDRVLRESGVDQTPPPPTWAAYAQEVAERFGSWLVRGFPNLSRLRHLPAALGVALIAAAVALVLAVLVMAIRAGLRRHRLQRAGGRVSAPRVVPAPAAPPDRDRSAWREEIERSLAAGDVARALEALWWWFARTVSASRVDAAWTSRELLAHSGRVELAPLALALDRLLYGAERPRPETIRRFLREGEEALA